jgi:hypothetical protein
MLVTSTARCAESSAGATDLEDYRWQTHDCRWRPEQDRFAVILDGPESCCCCRWSFGLPNHR